MRNTHQSKKGGGTHCTSPLTGKPIDGRLVPNQALLQQIVEYCMKHGLPARTLTTPEPR